MNELYSKYPFFFDDSVEAEEWENRRKDSLELEVYAATKEVFAENSEYKVELEKLFARYQYFFLTTSYRSLYLFIRLTKHLRTYFIWK